MAKSVKILLFLAQGFEDLEAVSIMDVMGWTEYRQWLPTVEVITTGFRDPVKSRFGLVHSIDKSFTEIEPRDYSALVIPGGFHSHGFNEAYDERLRELARTFHSQSAWIATFCVGILPVAEAGLLQGKKAVSYPFSRNHDNLGRLKQLGANLADDLMVVDDRIISCQGPGSSLDVAFYLLQALIGAEHCQEVKRLMCMSRC